MNAPPVQYVTTSDGLNIAYIDVGEGLPFVFTSNLWTHIQYMWGEIPLWRDWLWALASHFRVVYFDWRGSGMSSRDLPESFAMRDLELDLDAVVKKVALERFILYGIGSFAHVAIRYAAEHPEQVLALIVQSSAVRPDAWPTAIYRQLHAQSWELFLRANLPAGVKPEEVRDAMERADRTIKQRDVEVKSRAFHASSIEDILSRLAVPTLVLHPRDYILPPPREGMELAARITDSRFVLIEGSDIVGEPDSALQAVRRFLFELGLVDEAPVATSRAGADDDVEGRGRPSDAPLLGLSARQAEVLRLIAAGKTNREIADELFLSLRTVERHVTDIYDRLGVRNRAKAIAVALGRLNP